MRERVLEGMSQKQIADVARACNRYPVVSLEYAIDADEVAAGAPVGAHVFFDIHVREW